MAYEPPRYQTQPVNFGDTNDDFGRRTQTDGDNLTHLSGYTSGITVPYSEPLNERGETQAQALASEYSKSRLDANELTPPGNPTARYGGLAPPPQDPDKRKSSALESNDALTYIDEDFNYYSSRRNRAKRDSPTEALLVANAYPPAGQEGARPNDMGTSGFDLHRARSS